MLMLGGAALRGRALEWAGRIAAKTGCKLMAEYHNARLEAGAGRVHVPRLPYVVDNALAATRDVRELVLVGAKSPVSFFAYPGKPSVLVQEQCNVTGVATVAHDIEHALEAIAAELGATGTPPAHTSRRNDALPTGPISIEGVAAVLAALMPENAVVCDESVSTGRGFSAVMATAAPHDWLNLMGGSIGWALPAATGAALGAPDRKVIALEGDGSGMYTLQALWTMARESLNVTVVILANRSYQILRGELKNVGAGTPGKNATDMLMLDRPDLDWCALAKGMGIEAARAATLEELARQLRQAYAQRGPHLVEAVMA
jgi:acetolactate synthase-1/2/3 large subunit